jgi:hypothetical protein
MKRPAGILLATLIIGVSAVYAHGPVSTCTADPNSGLCDHPNQSCSYVNSSGATISGACTSWITGGGEGGANCTCD